MWTEVFKKRLKFLFSSVVLSLLLFAVKYVRLDLSYFYIFLICVLTVVISAWALGVYKVRNSWPFVFIPHLLITFGSTLSLFAFPNISLALRLIFIFSVSLVYYVMYLVLNIFAVVLAEGRTIPLFRVASTWAQILLVSFSIPLFSGVFKIPANPFVHILLITICSFLIFYFHSWVVYLDTGITDFSLAAFSTFWILMLSVPLMFIPFEAVFRGLFISSVVLFGLGFIQGSLKHTLTRKIILEHVAITIAFLILGLLFIP